MAYSPFINPTTRPYDLNPDAFSSVGGGTQTQKVLTVYDAYAPNELLTVFERHNHSPGLRLMLKAMGFSRGTAAPTTGHWEYPWRENLLYVGTIVTASTGAGTDVVISLNATSMYNAQVTVNGAAVQSSYPVVGQIIRLPNGMQARIMAKNTAVTPHQLTIRPSNAANDLAGNIVAGNSYALITNAHGEGTGLPAGRLPRVIKYTNQFQIIKAKAAVTGSSLTNKMYFNPVPGRQGSFYLKTEADMKYRFENDASRALLLGAASDNLTEFNTELGHDVPITTTEGMFEFISGHGNTNAYTAGGFTINDFDAIGFKLEDERVGTRNYCAWMGINLYNEIENSILQSLNNDVAALLTKEMLNFTGTAPNDEFQPMSPEDFALKIAFRGIQKNGYKYGFKMLHEFNNVQGVGSTGYNFKQTGIFTPLGFTSAPDGAQACFTGYEFKQLGDYSREVVVANIVGAGANFTELMVSDQWDRRQTGMLSEISYHGACPNKAVVLQPV